MSKRPRKVSDETGQTAIASVLAPTRKHYMTYRVYYLIGDRKSLAAIGAEWFPTADVGKAVRLVDANLPEYIKVAGHELRIEMSHRSADCSACRS